MNAKLKLFIDTSSNQKTIIKIGDKSQQRHSHVWHSQVVLPMITAMLRRQGCTLSDVTEIEVNPGPGSYTGLRVGVSIANALGYAFKIPVNGKNVSRLEIIEPQYE